MIRTLLSIELLNEQDVVVARQRLRQIAALVGCNVHEQTAIATAVSELARNAHRYAGGGRVSIALRPQYGPTPAAIVVRIVDRGPGISELPTILGGRYQSKTGMGLGIIGARRLSDEFAIESFTSKDAPNPPGTQITIAKHLPSTAPRVDAKLEANLAAELAREFARDPLNEVTHQNRELLLALDELRSRQADVERLNAELAETNRGVLALYAELDEKATSLAQASLHKTRFLSDMTHELRTPLNAIISLSRLLLDRVDGTLSAEQEKQCQLIFRSAAGLGEMVNDLLDIARIEAGKTDVQLTEFSITELLGAIRGIFRPLMPEDGSVSLIIEDDSLTSGDCPTILYSDERKVSQILRNLISNAIKFTPGGSVSVRVGPCDPHHVHFSVADTGIGIAPEDLDKIFEDFTQIDSPRQRSLRGTGLGLPLARKLATLLGGELTVTSSRLGVGSTFTLTLPVRSDGVASDSGETDGAHVAGGARV